MIAGTYAGLRWGRLRPAIPRASGFNGGIVFDCPRFARAFANVSTPYGVFESVCSYLCYSLCLEFCCLEYALRRSLLVVVGRRSCALSFAVVFSVVGSS